MRKIFKSKIISIGNNSNEKKYDYSVLLFWDKWDKNCIFLEKKLSKMKNSKLNYKNDYKLYNEVYSPKGELKVFNEIFDDSLKTGRKVHIVGISLREEVEILKDYYTSKWFYNDSMNCFQVDFSEVLVTASVKIENLIYGMSDYKSMKERILFIPPPREPKHVKALFNWINSGVVAWIHLVAISEENTKFISKCIQNEKILPLRIWKLLYYNFIDIWIDWEKNNLIIEY